MSCWVRCVLASSTFLSVFLIPVARLICITQVKFIKFFGWEDRWIARVLSARKVELDWLIKGRLNSIMFNTLWITVPILVSVISFFAHVVVAGKELDVGTAFTAIALFGMLRRPLNSMPNLIVVMLQVRFWGYF